MELRANASRNKKFQSKDGQSYGSYNEMCQANIRHNEAILSKKGLDLASFRLIRPQRTHPTEQQRKLRAEQHAAVAVPKRASRRIRRAPPLFQPLMEHDADYTTIPRRRRPTKRKANPMNVVALTAADRRKLHNENNWLVELDTYLRDVQELSQPNRRSVMRQVEKLSAGLGITYHRWKSDVCFSKDVKVALDMDFGAMYEEACHFEAKHGKDLGNGWLLRHPIKKLEDFQVHTLANK